MRKVIVELDKTVVMEIITLFRRYKDATPAPRLIESLDGIGHAEDFDEFDTTNFYVEKILQAIRKLTPNARAELIAIMLLGREDTNQDNFDILLQDAKAISSSSKNDAYYLIGRRKLDQYLKAGLRKLGL